MNEEILSLVDPEMLNKIDYAYCSVVELNGGGKALVFTGSSKDAEKKVKNGGKPGKVKIDPSLVDEHYVEQGQEKNPLEFDYYVVFDDEMTKKIEGTRTFVEDDEAWDMVGVPEKYQDRINIAANSEELDTALVEQSVIANSDGAYVDEKMQLEYAGHASVACDLVAEQLPYKKYDHVIAVLRAGEFAKQSMESQLEPGFQYHAVEAKRVALKSKRLTVGYIDHSGILGSDALESSRTLVTELCGASGVTVLGLESINKSRGIRPREVQLIAPVVSQRGAQLLMDSFYNITIQSGPELVRLMNEKYYLIYHAASDMGQKVRKRLEELGLPVPEWLQVLGDGGDLTNRARLASKNS